MERLFFDLILNARAKDSIRWQWLKYNDNIWKLLIDVCNQS